MPRRPHAWCATLALLVISLLCVSGVGVARAARPVLAARQAGLEYVELTSLARASGVVATSDGSVLTFRAATGVLTFFAGSSEGLLQRPGDGGPSEEVFSAPVVLVGEEWWAPLDAVLALGVQPNLSGDALELPGGEVLELERVPFPGGAAPPYDAGGPASDGNGEDPAWEVDELALGVPVLRLYSGAVALSLLDLAMLPLARPDLMSAVDGVLDSAWNEGGVHGSLLLLQVVALSESAWESSLRFKQNGMDLEVRYPYRLLLGEGSPESVAPGAPATGVVLLPPAFDLYRPLRVEWAGVSAEVSFRR